VAEDQVAERSLGASARQREGLLAQTFVDVADTLVADFDIVDFLTMLTHRCVELFDLSEAGLLLANPPDRVRVVASSSHRMELLELFELQHDEGPCLDCYRSGNPVRCDDLRGAAERWPMFAPEALAAGWASVYALPMRLRDRTIGSLNLLRVEPWPPGEAELVTAQALADVATIGILQYRAAEEQRLLAEQLQHALDSRVAVEQAKGVLAEYAQVSMETAFSALRRYARDHNRRLVDVAVDVVDRSLAAETVAPRRGAD
jgi:GAF domain-containing protein